MSMDLRSTAAVAGVGLYGLGEAPGETHMEIMARAVKIALDDAGIELAEVDGLFTTNMNNLLAGPSVAEYLGIVPRVTDATNFGGSAFVAYLQSASMAIAIGLCEVALICYGSNQRTASGKLHSPVEPQPYEAPYQPRNPITAYALATARHMHEHGTTRRDLAEVAVSMRDWAQRNPDAFLRDPLTVDEVLAARMVADPLSVRDCCLVTDGGGAVVLVSAARAARMRKTSVWVRGFGVAHTHKSIMEMPDLTVTPAAISGPLAFGMAGVQPADIDVVELYDAFTINPILFMEDLGFCAKGQGGRLFAEGHTRPGGRIPVNTNGGGLSCTHPGMYGIFTIIEAVQQLRGEAGARQVSDCTLALVHGNGGTLASQATGILGLER
ncbi:acetyl-CoA acetyltransferase [Pararhodobacter sp. CCB-MM2]|uniref:acetyl-CoA acetyltransferase n=1 Tax=Pararhodobacter sp. CCB-MM2 TaxID=1786003 RepID=UPI00082E139A|nr:acetyl-CoA acetyltransferase [Pararhodobacter sp. CCB-MM2]